MTEIDVKARKAKQRRERRERFKNCELTVDKLKALLRYEPETGKWFWLIKRRTIAMGAEAGTIRKDGRRAIQIDERIYLSSRLAVLYMTGVWPPHDVDHEDTDESNDRWSNLRPATRSQNSCNRNITGKNKSGYKGVSWFERDKNWLAKIQIGRKQIYLGYFDDPAKAHEAYCLAAAEYHGAFARTK